MFIDPTLAALNAEWAALSTDTATASRWVALRPELAPAVDVAAVLARIRDEPDVIFGALLWLGAHSEPLARRVILQAMLGAAVRVSVERRVELAEVASELWLAIAEYPWERRTRSIAANLAWALRRRFRTQQPVLAPVPIAEPSADDTLQLARKLGLIDPEGYRTLWLVYVAGLSSAGAAAELGISPELVRYRCSRHLRRLAGHARSLAA